MKQDREESAEQYARDFWTDYDANQEQRDKANEELRFMLVAGGQWEGYLEQEYENRAKMEMDQVSEYLWRTYADWTDNRLAPNYSPDDEATTDEDAELLDGLYRRDVRRRGGQSSIDTAVMEAMACGCGAVVLNEEYEDDTDPENERQNISFTETPNAYSCVAFDSGARKADKSDARRVTIVTPYTKDSFHDKYPDAELSSFYVNNRSHFNWNTANFTYVGTRYHLQKKRIKIRTYSHPQSDQVIRLQHPFEDEQELLQFGYRMIRERPITTTEVIKTVFTGDTILEKARRVAGEFLPVIAFHGFRAFVDGVEHFNGLARKRMDGQRIMNMSFSLAAESAAHSSEGKPIFTPEQVQGLEQTWSQNTHNKAYHLADPVRNPDGTIAQTGPVGFTQGSQLAPAASALIQMSYEYIRAGTGGAPQDIADPEASGKAINAIIKRVDKTTRPIFDNIAMSIKHMAKVYQSKCREVYGGKVNMGRTIRTVNERDKTLPVQLLAPRPEGFGVTRINDVSKGKYEVVVDVAKDYNTQREETIEGLKDILQGLPPEMPGVSELIPPLVQELIMMLPSAGLENIKKQVRKLQLIGGAEPENDEEIQFVQQVKQAQNGKDANTMLLEAASKEQETKALINAQKVKQMEVQNRKLAAETEKIQVDMLETLKELGVSIESRIPPAVNGGATAPFRSNGNATGANAGFTRQNEVNQ